MGIRDLVKTIENLNGKNVTIQITHKLYGDQKIKCDLCIIDDMSRLGFCVGDQEIYIEKKAISEFGIKNGICFWADKIMKIEMQTT